MDDQALLFETTGLTPMSGVSYLPRLLRRRQLLLGLGSCALSAAAEAASFGRYELRAVVNPDSAANRKLLEALGARYPGLVHSAEPSELTQRPGAGAYLAIGPTALQATLDAELHAPLVSLFTSRQTFQRMTAPAAGGRVGVSAIFAEASPLAQLELIAALYQRSVNVGVLLSDTTIELEPMLQHAARRLDLGLVVKRVAREATIGRELAALPDATVLLALPDSTLYSYDNVRVLLASTYRRGKAVIGFSPALVTSGAVATAYASVDDVLAHLDTLMATIDAGQTPEPQYPRYWRVVVNEAVARSLNLIVTDEVRSLGNRSQRE